MALLNDFLIKSNILTDIASAGGETIKWFEGLTIGYFIQNILFPILGLILLCIFLKTKYRGNISDQNNGSEVWAFP